MTHHYDSSLYSSDGTGHLDTHPERLVEKPLTIPFYLLHEAEHTSAAALAPAFLILKDTEPYARTRAHTHTERERERERERDTAGMSRMPHVHIKLKVVLVI